MKTWVRGAMSASSKRAESNDGVHGKSETAGAREIPRWPALARLVDSDGFQLFIGAVIVANAVVLGIQTYQSIEREYGSLLSTLNEVFYGVFLVELVLRLLSYGKKPWNFFRSGWNVFDFIVIGGALIPALREQATVLRLLRLARVVRLMRFLPDARVLVLTVTRATPAVASMAVLTVLVLFIYGIVGWTMFGAELPQQWGDIGAAMLTLFVLLTLESFPEYLNAAREVNSFATLFFLSYVLIAAFIIVNLLIGIVISSMERAREQEAAEARKLGQDHLAALLEHLGQARQQIDELEGEVEMMRNEGYFRGMTGSPNTNQAAESQGASNSG